MGSNGSGRVGTRDGEDTCGSMGVLRACDTLVFWSAVTGVSFDLSCRDMTAEDAVVVHRGKSVAEVEDCMMG